MKLRVRLTLLFVSLIAVSSIVVFMLALGNASRVLVIQVEQQLESLAAAKEEEIEIYVDGQLDNVRGITSRTKFRDTIESYLLGPNEEDRQTISKIVTDSKEPFVNMHAISVFEPGGAFVAGTVPEVKIDDGNLIELIEKGSDKETILAESVEKVYVAGPVVRNSELLGVTVIELGGNKLAQIITDHTGLGETGELLLAARNSNGDAQFLHSRRFENHPDALKVVLKSDIVIPITQSLLRRETSLLEAVDYRGQPVISATRYIDDVDWGLVVKIDQAEVLKNLINFRTTLIFLMIVVIFFTGVIAYITSVAMIQPLEILTKYSRDVAAGDLNVQMLGGLIRQKDEIGLLGQSFDTMTKKLRSIYKGLEDKVKDRTRKLEKSLNTAKQQKTDLEKTKTAMLSILEDLRDEKKKLEVSQVRDEAILASMGDGLIVTDKNRRVLVANEMAAKLTRVAVKDLIGHKWPDALGVDGKSKDVIDESGEMVARDMLPIVQALERGEQVTSTKLRFLREDGESIPVAITASPLIIRKKIVGAIVVFRDISKEKEVDKAKTEFVSLASHQLRTPLSTINWYAEMLMAGDAGKLKSEQKKYVEEIYTGNQRMVDLVNALLNVSRIELGTFMVEPVPTNIVELAQSVVKELEPNIFKRKIGLEESYEKDIPLMNVDPKLLRIVFQNLLSNAVKYTPKKGQVKLTVKKEGKELLIDVADTGYGIPKDQQDKIFTKLFRADNVREKDTTGTGLGLYLVKSIVQHSGGAVSFESVIDKGTTFSVRLPLVGMKAKKGTRKLGE